MSYDPTAILKVGYDLEGLVLTRVGHGSIHETWLCGVRDYTPQYVLQHVHAMFPPLLQDDIEAVTAAVERHDPELAVPRMVRTTSAALAYTGAGERWWRLMTYVPGTTIDALDNVECAVSAARLVARFHAALAGASIQLRHRLPHFMDVPYYMGQLEEACNMTSASPEVKQLGCDVLSKYRALGMLPSSLPKRIIHGDLKINNVRFRAGSAEAIGLIDLDTVMSAPVAIELGDAFRSWCNPAGEDGADPRFDAHMYQKARDAFFAQASFLTEEERASIPHGVRLITLALAARFLTDAVRQSYFTWDQSRYASRYEQNLTRGKHQLELYHSIDNQLEHTTIR